MRHKVRYLVAIAALGAIGAAFAGPGGWSSPLVRDRAAKDAPQHVHHPPGSIIGNEPPQLIPSEIAIALMFRAIATAASAGERHLGGYFDNIEGISGTPLAHADRVAITTAARAYVNAMSSAPQDDGRIDLARHRARTVSRVWGDLHRALSPEAQIALQFFVEQYVKRNVKLLNY